jgi:hypothetical protein
MQEKGLQIGESLTTALGNELLENLGLATFMNDEQCNRYSGVYADAVSGWNYRGIFVFHNTCFTCINWKSCCNVILEPYLFIVIIEVL